MKKSVILIGMPGAGKSTIGVLLAKALGLPFTDTDLLIQEKEKKFLQDIINTDGIQAFLGIEERVIIQMPAKSQVVATGGSVVYSSKAMDKFKEEGLVVYLKLDFDHIEKRIKNITSRGIAMGSNQSLLDLYIERTPLYESYADITVDCSGKSPEVIISIIKSQVQSYG